MWRSWRCLWEVSEQQSRGALLAASGFRKGIFPVRYLGVPLITSQLSVRECELLTDKIMSRIRGGTVQFLSFAGRLQLIYSVMFSMMTYWCALFILPRRVIEMVQRLSLRTMIVEFGGWGAKVKWSHVCKPRREGGFGVRHREQWNKVGIFKNIWLLFLNSGSLWAAWVHKNLIRGRCFSTLKRVPGEYCS